MEINIGEKTVTLQHRFPMREWDSVRGQFNNLTSDTPWQKRAGLLRRFVLSWEFDGDPQDIEAWGDLDLFEEVLPLEQAIVDLILKPKYEIAKNLVSESTTP